MKTLLVARHAKSSWAEAGMSDHDRPLNERGKEDAPRMGRVLKSENLVPDLIVSSTAKRARKTASKMAKACGYVGEIELAGSLYLGHPSDYVHVLQQVGDEHPCVLVVGHNPGLEDLMEELTGQYVKMPTGAVAQVALEIDRWSEFAIPPGGRFVKVFRPKELP
jgi:phosphohistidine phosphatase